jgi:hypothetical protein
MGRSCSPDKVASGDGGVALLTARRTVRRNGVVAGITIVVNLDGVVSLPIYSFCFRGRAIQSAILSTGLDTIVKTGGGREDDAGTLEAEGILGVNILNARCGKKRKGSNQGYGKEFVVSHFVVLLLLPVAVVDSILAIDFMAKRYNAGFDI